MTLELTVPLDHGRETIALHYPAGRASVAARAGAHGAGAGQRHAWMVAVATGLAARGIDVVTLDFPYMHERRRVPDRAPALERCFEAAIAVARHQEALRSRRLFIGDNGAQFHPERRARRKEESAGKSTGTSSGKSSGYSSGKPAAAAPRGGCATKVRPAWYDGSGGEEPTGSDAADVPEHLAHVASGDPPR